MATPKPFPDRRERLFGRERDLEALCARVRFKGLTAVAARPQMGKSWLLAELARRLSQDHEPRHLVGFAESFGETPDLLLRTVIDLYTRWLSDAGYWQQAKMVWEQQKPNLLPGIAKTVARIFKETAGKAAKPVAVAVEDAINGLIAADQSLKTGGVQLPTLTYEQARDLVAAVAAISERRVALFLDQWEKSPDVAREAKALDAFIRHLDDWPHCHVFLALRPDEPAYGTVQKLEASLRGPVADLSPRAMQLADPAEQARLIRYVQRDVAAAARADDQTLLGLVDGYPGVIYQWTNDYQREHMRSRADLERVAADAQAYRFSELDDLLPKLAGRPASPRHPARPAAGRRRTGLGCDRGRGAGRAGRRPDRRPLPRQGPGERRSARLRPRQAVGDGQGLVHRAPAQRPEGRGGGADSAARRTDP